MNINLRRLLFIILNGLVFLFEILAIILQPKPWGIFFLSYVSYFHLLLIGISVFNIVFNIINFKKDFKCKWLYILNILSNTGVLLGFSVCVMVYIPIYGVKYISTFTSCVYYLIIPVLAIINIFLDDNRYDMKNIYCLVINLPELIYGAVILIAVVNDAIKAPYSFLDIKNNDVVVSILSIFGIILLTWLLSYLINGAHQLMIRKKH